MDKPIEEGCLVKIICPYEPVNGTIVEILFKSESDNGIPTWIMSEELEDRDGFMCTRISEQYLRRIDDDKELCTSWEDIKLISGWVPEHLKDVA